MQLVSFSLFLRWVPFVNVHKAEGDGLRANFCENSRKLACTLAGPGAPKQARRPEEP